MLTEQKSKQSRIKPLIYFSGPDGSGKTTLIDGTHKELLSQNIKSKKLYGMNKFLRYIGKRMDWFGNKIRRTERSNHTFRRFVSTGAGHFDRDDGSRLWKAKKGALLVFGIVDVIIGYFYTMIFRLRGYTVLVETSPYDIFLKYHMPHFPKLEPFLNFWIPLPTRGFLLKAPPEAINKRKPELNVDELALYYKRIGSLLKSKPHQKAYRQVSTEQNPNGSIENIMSTIMQLN